MSNERNEVNRDKEKIERLKLEMSNITNYVATTPPSGEVDFRHILAFAFNCLAIICDENQEDDEIVDDQSNAENVTNEFRN